jgi:hypothetical protein
VYYPPAGSQPGDYPIEHAPHANKNSRWLIEHAMVKAWPDIKRLLYVNSREPRYWTLVQDELRKAVAKFPTWPTDPLHALAVLGEEFGELTKAVLQLTYEPHKTRDGEVRTEAIQTAAMALRFLESLDVYTYQPGRQHEQGALAAAPEAPKAVKGTLCWNCPTEYPIDAKQCPHCHATNANVDPDAAQLEMKRRECSQNGSSNGNV